VVPRLFRALSFPLVRTAGTSQKTRWHPTGEDGCGAKRTSLHGTAVSGGLYIFKCSSNHFPMIGMVQSLPWSA